MTTPLTLELRSYSDEVTRHHHDHHQLVLPVAGELSLTIAHTGGAVSREQAAVIPAGHDHGFAAGDDNQFLVADIPDALAPAMDRLPLFFPLDPALRHYLAFLHHQVRCGAGSAASQRQMLLLLLQLMQERQQPVLAVDHRIAAAQAYLDDHFQQPLVLSQLAAVAHLSVRQLTELFRRQLGLSPQQYLVEKRMQQAWQLLETTSQPIQAVAEQVGYRSQAAFSDRFRRHFGQSPSHFRRRTK
ncbi:AraC family transcriptional regulator [Marinobacter xestospongiae]|uniref:AraC family transcriptional regulator n=1 Tax=Marinobacter xestospongiae TaxID=994319 RepID=A0ABU3W1W8_9GAMM|nr:AraC family transcriptional regulator [Marinobacter xestospongiae]MDV2080514.1 AraC family transcriptional regulator [Marinobacter xestospongiae]